MTDLVQTDGFRKYPLKIHDIIKTSSFFPCKYLCEGRLADKTIGKCDKNHKRITMM